LAQELQDHPQRHLIERSLVSLLQVTHHERGQDAWRLISGALADISEALEVFHPHRDTRKITVFGSARTVASEPCYGLAEQLKALNLQFDDLVDEGVIQARDTVDDHGLVRPCLHFHFNRRRIGRLYQLLDALNSLPVPPGQVLEQPGRRQPITPP
jgi:hypothetical protein